MSQYFPKPYQCYSGNVKVKLYLSNYATKTDLKPTIGADTILSSKIRFSLLKR